MKIAVPNYIRLVNGTEPEQDILINAIEELTHDERVELRESLVTHGCNKLMRNLYYDYKLQVWIEPSRVLVNQ